VGLIASPACAASATETAQLHKIVHVVVTAKPADKGHTQYSMFRSVALVDLSSGQQTGSGTVAPAVFHAAGPLREPRAYATGAVIVPASTSSSCITDGGYRVGLCGWINYDFYTSGGWKYVSISSVQSQGKRLDTQASLAKLSWTAYQTGGCGLGCSGTLNHQKSGSATSPGSGTTYTMSTGWAGQYQRLSTSPFDVAGLKQTLTYNWRGQSLALSQQLALA
jgi:hypothetical protein